MNFITEIICLTNFLKTNLGKFAFMHLSEKGPKGSFFAHDELENHTTKKKEVKGEKERARRKKGGEEKKEMGCTLPF